MRKFLLITVAVTMLSSLFCYKKELSRTVEYSPGAWNDSRGEFIFLKWERDFHMPKGIAKFPDGGVPEYVRDERSICLYSKETGEVKVIATGRGIPRGYPPSVRFSWKGDSAVYKIWSSDPAENIQNPVVLINMKTYDQREFNNAGEMPELSPDCRMIATVDGNTLQIMNTDGTERKKIYAGGELELLFVMWNSMDEIDLHVREKGRFLVYTLNLNRERPVRSVKPYLKNFGNESTHDVLTGVSKP